MRWFDKRAMRDVDDCTKKEIAPSAIIVAAHHLPHGELVEPSDGFYRVEDAKLRSDRAVPVVERKIARHMQRLP